MYKKISLFILVFISYNHFFAQGKVERKNSTYMYVDTDYLPSQIKWGNDTLEDFYFFYEQKSTCDNCVDITPKKSFAPLLSGKNLFRIDTTVYLHGNYGMYYSPEFFKVLERVDLSMSSKKDGKLFVGEFTNKINVSKSHLKELAKILIHFGVISTYSHLNAEMVQKTMVNNSKQMIIRYNVIWHYCTNDCYDPKYSFELFFDKTNSKIYVYKI